MPQPKSESEIQREIMLAIGCRKDLRVWRNNTGAARLGDRWVRFGIPGAPDIEGILAPTGRYVGIEVKRPGGKLTQRQVAFGHTVDAFGGLYIVAVSVEDVLGRLP